jgi:acyl-CoA reductase-like NAD-dependent aldehyde dehydrogenase
VITARRLGNRVMLKPSELTPVTSLLGSLIGKSFCRRRVVRGAWRRCFVGRVLLLAFDHLFFTGSTDAAGGPVGCCQPHVTVELWYALCGGCSLVAGGA